MINQLSVLRSFLSTQHKSNMNTANHIARLESQFSLLAVMRKNFEEEFKVIKVLSSLGGHRDYMPTIASLNTLQEEMVACNYVINLVTEQYKRLKQESTGTSRRIVGNNGYLASSAQQNSVRMPLKHGTSKRIRRLNCNKLEIYMRNCSVRQRYQGVSQTGKSVAQKGRNFYKNDSHSKMAHEGVII